MTAPRLELRGVGHAYGGRVVIAGVDYVLEPGRSLGLLGPNGSGKSTLLRCIAGLQRPRAGHVLVDGEESCELPPAARARVAYAGHRPLLWGGLSARENLALCAGLYGLPAETAERALAAADLAETAERPPPRSRRASASGSRSPAHCSRSRAARAGRAAQRARRGQLPCGSTRVLAEARGDVTLVLATHERVARPSSCATSCCSSRCCAERAPRAVRPRRRPARAHRPPARAPRAAASARDGPVRGGRAGRPALRRRHRRSRRSP